MLSTDAMNSAFILFVCFVVPLGLLVMGLALSVPAPQRKAHYGNRQMRQGKK